MPSHRALRASVIVACVTAVVTALGMSPVSAGTHPAVPKTYLSPLTPSQIQQLSRDATDKVIVLFRNQHPEAPTVHTGRAARLAADQRPVLSEFAQLRAGHVRSYSF